MQIYNVQVYEFRGFMLCMAIVLGVITPWVLWKITPLRIPLRLMTVMTFGTGIATYNLAFFCIFYLCWYQMDWTYEEMLVAKQAAWYLFLLNAQVCAIASLFFAWREKKKLQRGEEEYRKWLKQSANKDKEDSVV